MEGELYARIKSASSATVFIPHIVLLYLLGRKILLHEVKYCE